MFSSKSTTVKTKQNKKVFKLFIGGRIGYWKSKKSPYSAKKITSFNFMKRGGGSKFQKSTYTCKI